MRLIDADELLKNEFKNDISFNAFQNLVKRQKTIDAVPREELFNLFVTITSAEYTKQRFFAQEDGTIYDRCKGDYLHNFDLAVVRFCNELSEY